MSGKGDKVTSGPISELAPHSLSLMSNVDRVEISVSWRSSAVEGEWESHASRWFVRAI